jgi:hypothetical protein
MQMDHRTRRRTPTIHGQMHNDLLGWFITVDVIALGIEP